jgi:hypothetical protein
LLHGIGDEDQHVWLRRYHQAEFDAHWFARHFGIWLILNSFWRNFQVGGCVSAICFGSSPCASIDSNARPLQSLAWEVGRG